MCEECTAPVQLRRAFPCGCGCLGARRFLTSEERIEMLEEYRRKLQREIAGVEEAIREIKQG